MKFLIVGAGLSGAVVSRVLAEGGHRVVLLDERSHIAGNCFTERDESTGVLAHRYGPHLFHTSRPEVVDFVLRHGKWVRNQHRVKATTKSGVYSMPINLLTLNQFFDLKLGSLQMQEHVAGKTEAVESIRTFEDQALAMVGRELYEEFFEGYTSKQWGRSPATLPASILKRLPMRFTYDDRYFSDDFEALPEHGYTEVVDSILDHPSIELTLNTKASPSDSHGFDHTVWTGPLDVFFDTAFGPLPYRTLDFEWQVHEYPYQGCAQMNYCEASVPHTRITEHNFLEPWRAASQSLTATEKSREAGPNDIPYYPVHLSHGNDLLERYRAAATEKSGVTFVGRLGTFRYLDMDASIAEALAAGHELVRCAFHDEPIPSFCDVG